MTPNEQKLLAELLITQTRLRLLKTKIKFYCDGYTTRSMKQDGRALERLRKEAEEA